MTGMHCFRQCGGNDFEDSLSGRNPGFFVIVTERKGSRFWAPLGSYAFVYYPAVTEKELASISYMAEVIYPSLLMFFSHGYLLHGDPRWNRSHKLLYHL